MKILFFTFLTSLTILSSTALMAKEIENTNNKVNVARVVELVKLVNKADIQINVTVTDLGGSTDLSPTQKLFFNIYQKGEIFSTDASYDLGAIYSFKKAVRVSAGVYEIDVLGVNAETTMPEYQTLIVNAEKAIVRLKSVRCEDFDCEASTNFKASISVNQK
jgi:hypothetical protein